MSKKRNAETATLREAATREAATLGTPVIQPPRWTQEGDRGLVVWKHLLHPIPFEEHILSLPRGSEIVSVDWEDDHAALFYLVDPEAPRVERRLIIVQTHREGLPRCRFIATIRNPAGLALHVFELP